MAQWNSNPFAGIGGPGKSSSGFSFSPHASRPKATASLLTTQQILALQLALHHSKSGSFWDEVKHAGGSAFHPVGWALDKITRPLYGIATAETEGQKAENKHLAADKAAHKSWWQTEKDQWLSGDVYKAMGHGFMQGLEGKKHDTMSSFLKVDPYTAKWAKKHRVQAGIAGLGLDVAADPLTYVTGGAGTVLTKSASHARLVAAGDFALHGEDDLKTLKAAHDALKAGGADYSHRAALAGERVHQLENGVDAGAADRLHIAQNVAQAEKRRVEKFLPQYRIGTKGRGIPITPTFIGGTRVVPALPKLDNFIARSPVGAKVAESFRNKFIRAADETPEAHAARITRQHIQEAHAQENLNIVRDTMRGVKISEKAALQALHHGESTKNFLLKTKKGNFRLNEGAIAKLMREGKLDETQVLFLRRWFKATELLHLKDKALGVAYHHTGEAGRLYVPHLVDKLGRPLVDLQKNTLTKATFQHSRGKGGLTVLQLAEKAKAGELGRGVETNPFMLLAHTARQRAAKQADMSLANTYARGLGIKTRVVDTARLTKAQQALETLGMEHGVHQEAHAESLANAHHAEQEWLANHEQTFNDKFAQLQKQHRSFKYRGVKRDKFFFTEHGEQQPLSAAKEMGYQVHNLHDQHGNVIASMVHSAEKGDSSHYIESVFVRPEFRKNPAVFKKLIEPILKDGRPIAAAVQNPRLLKLIERAGIRVDKNWFLQVPEHDHILRNAPTAKLPKLRTSSFSSTKAASVARVQKQLIKLHENHINDLEQIAKGKHAPLNQHIAPHLETAAQHHEAMQSIVQQQKHLEQVIKRLQVGKANRGVYSKVRHVTVPGITDEHGHALAFEPEVGHAITKYQKIASGDDKAIEDFADGWRKYMAKWKLAVTSVNPGYRIRNSMSDVWAMYLSGVPMHAVPRYAGKAAKLAREARNPAQNPEAAKLITEAYHHGILSGLYQGDVQAVAGFIKYSGSKRGLVKQGHPLQAATKMMQDFNANVENLGRMTHYLYRREVLKESPITAAQKVKAAHFDYEDLTPFEQRKMKAIAPFYTWTRKNLPFQVKALVSAPGKFAAFPKAMAESEQASGGDAGNIVPDYIPGGFGFQLPFGKHNYYMPQIGATDLSILDSPGGALQRAEGLVNPAVRTPFELAANKNLYTGAQIASDTHDRNPVSNIGADLLGLIPGSNVGQTSRMVNGKRVYGPGADPYYAYLLGQVPMLRQLGLNYSGINKGKNTTNALSYFLGQSVQHVDPSEQKMIDSIKLQDELKKEVRSLRDAGLLKEAKGKKSKNQKLIDNLLFGREGR